MSCKSSLHILAVLATAALTLPAVAADQVATAALENRDGESVGVVTLTAMPHGTLVHARLDGLAPGTHAFHVHETGRCVGDFTSAGGHYNPESVKHGFLVDQGYHAGDLPNIHVPANGVLEVEYFSRALTMDDRLFDDDGAAIIIHDGADDYASQPAGAAGKRIACGVITR